jgi:acetyl esterase/lipase
MIISSRAQSRNEVHCPCFAAVCGFRLHVIFEVPDKSAPVPIWPKAAPGEPGPESREHDTTSSKDALVAGKRVIRLTDVTRPAITVYHPAGEANTGTAIVVFPGGGYKILAMDLEGTEVCDWLSAQGVTCVLLKYRVPPAPGTLRYTAPLQDAQRTVGLVRSHAKDWHLNPQRIGVLGFSAGGHLAAVLSNNFEKRTYASVDNADSTSCRPDFAMLIYPAYLTEKDGGDKLASELPVTARTPPTFLVQTEDDPVKVENSLVYYAALKRAGVPAEMHLYSKGGHGYGLRKASDAVTGWPQLATEWLRSFGLLSRSGS